MNVLARWVPTLFRPIGKFARNITLPEAVDDNSSEAKYADGLLYLTLQKKRPARPSG